MNTTKQSNKKVIQNIGGIIGGVILIGALCFLVYCMGWTGFIIRFGLIAVTPLLVILLLFLIVFAVKWEMFYSKKEIGRRIKRFLGFNFGNTFEVIEPKDMTRRESSFRFKIRIPQDAMQNIIDYCNSSSKGKGTTNGYVIFEEYNSGSVERRKQLEINYNDCTIEFIGVKHYK